MSFSLSEYTKIDVSWGFAPELIGELAALPRPLAGFKGAAPRQDGNGGEGKTRGRGRRGKGGERGNGEGRGKRGSWG